MIEGTSETVEAARDERSSRAVVVCDTPVRAAMRGRCPRCGQGALFAGFLKVAPACAICGLDYTTIQTGDGPASFIMQIAGFIVGFSALFVEIKYHPPMWVHLIVCLIRLMNGAFTPKQHFGFEAAAWYWHFVDVVWLFLFAFVYVIFGASPH